MSKFDQVPSGPDKDMDARVTKWLQDNEDKLSDETKEYTTYDPNNGDHQEFDPDNSRNAKSRGIGAQAVNMMILPPEPTPGPEMPPEPTPEPTPAPEMPPEMPPEMQ